MSALDKYHEPLISLVEARELLKLLKAGEQEVADQYFLSIASRHQNDLFAQLGRMTRDLHDELLSFQIDPRLQDIAQVEIPNATDRLRCIITMTDNAAHRTMDAVEHCMPLARALSDAIAEIEPTWSKLMHHRQEINRLQFINLCHKIDSLIVKSKGDAEVLCAQLREILLAQDYQDLTGQMINRIITLVSEVENKLLMLLQQYKGGQADRTQDASLISKEQTTDIVHSQDEVDDLLASLGF